MSVYRVMVDETQLVTYYIEADSVSEAHDAVSVGVNQEHGKVVPNYGKSHRIRKENTFDCTSSIHAGDKVVRYDQDQYKIVPVDAEIVTGVAK